MGMLVLVFKFGSVWWFSVVDFYLLSRSLSVALHVTSNPTRTNMSKANHFKLKIITFMGVLNALETIKNIIYKNLVQID